MATTKIWTIHEGVDIKQVLNYASNEDKTVEQLEISIDTDMSYNQDEKEKLQDVIDYAMQGKDIDQYGNLIDYVSNDNKTEERKYVSAINCSVKHAREEMLITKQHYHKEDKIILWHGYQSFKPGEVTPEEAHKIGVELANNLWGKEYQILVATHLDHEHIHNHFVINSVSFRSGKKLDVRWRDMARESDRLCQLYGKSVIDRPGQKGKAYAELKAQKEGRATWTTAIKQDIDQAIQESNSLEQFLTTLKKRGYTIKENSKYFSLKPPGKERFVRIDRHLGYEYTLDGIEKRILDQDKTRTKKEIKPRVYRARGYVQKPKYKLVGIQALYIKYCYMLGVIPKRTINPARVHYLYREELTKMHKISQETRFLVKNNICNTQDLKDVQAELKEYVKALNTEKGLVRKQLANAPEAEKDNLSQKLDYLTKKIKQENKKLYYCRDISNRSETLQDKENYIKYGIPLKQEKDKERNRGTRNGNERENP